MRADNVPRISDVEVMARLLLDLGAEVEGIGTHDAARALPGRHEGRAGCERSSAGCADRSCCSGRCWRGAAARGSRRRAATFPARRTIATHLEALDAMGARVVDGAGPRARSAGRAEADVDLSRTRRRSPAPRRRCSPRPRRRADGRSATPPASRTSSSCAQFLESWASAITGSGTLDHPRSKAAARCAAPSTAYGAITSRRGAGRSSPR